MVGGSVRVSLVGCLQIFSQASLLWSLETDTSSFPRPGDPADAPAAVPGAGAGFCPDAGPGPRLPPGRPAGACQCGSGLWLLKTPVLSPDPWSANQEWQVRTERGRDRHRCPQAPSSGVEFITRTHRPCSVSPPPQAPSHGAVRTNLRAQLHRLWRGPREDQSHHWTQLLGEKHIPQTGEEPVSPSPLLPTAHICFLGGRAVLEDRPFPGHLQLAPVPSPSPPCPQP